ncbi:MAG: hypothetical protein WBD41_21840, partial [Rhodococcus sp. (in: high G+C Gram-positive bacteria)]
VWFEAGADVEYLPRARLSELLAQYHRFGRWKVRYWQQTGERPQNRQLVLLVAPALVLGVSTAGLVRWGGRAALAATVAGAIGAESIDRLGSSGPLPSPLVRLAAVTANAAVAAGWLSGIVVEGIATLNGSARR